MLTRVSSEDVRFLHRRASCLRRFIHLVMRGVRVRAIPTRCFVFHRLCLQMRRMRARACIRLRSCVVFLSRMRGVRVEKSASALV